MRISDWSSDVCSSDLHVLSDQSGQILEWPRHHHQRAARVGGCLPETLVRRQDRALHAWRELHGLLLVENLRQRRDRNVGAPADRLSSHPAGPSQPCDARLPPTSEARRVGKEWVRTCRSGWSPYL